MSSPLDTVQVQKGDLILTSGRSLLARLIRAAEVTRGEADGAWANHAGMFSTCGPLRSALAIESLWRTVEHEWFPAHIGDFVSVFRYRHWDQQQRAAAAHRMRSYVGKKYGWWKLFTNLIDNRWFGGRAVLRRLHFLRGRPICSYSAGLTYEELGVVFDDGRGRVIPGEALQPDDMDDSAMRHSENWLTVVYREEVR